VKNPLTAETVGGARRAAQPSLTVPAELAAALKKNKKSRNWKYMKT
jgi:hypothetical protein